MSNDTGAGKHWLLDVMEGKAALPYEQPVDLQHETDMRIMRKQMQDRTNEIIKKRDAARARMSEIEKQREKERAARDALRAEQLEKSERERAYSQWIECGNNAGDFHKIWPDMFLSIQKERMEAAAARIRSRGMQEM